MNDYVAVGLLALLASLFLVPIVRALAIAVNLVDKPDTHRKIHERTISLGGGVAVLLAVLIAMSAATLIPNPTQAALLAQSSQLFWFMIAALVLCAVGVIDDKRPLKGKHKLMGQVAAVLVLVFSGTVIEEIALFDYKLSLGLLAIPFTTLWLLAAINSLNLIDGVDGLATSVGIILCGTVAAIAISNGDAVDASLALAMVGALAGFLYFNFPPASIFLGDAGSMLIGLVGGALAVRCAKEGPTSVPMIAPLALWAIPFFDTSVALLRRKLTGRSIFSTDRGHLHHCLLRMGRSSHAAVFWIIVLSGITSLGALVSVLLHQDMFAVMSVLVVFGTLVGTGVFGHAEFLLLVNLFKNLAAVTLKPVARPTGNARHVRIQLQGSRNWDDIWEQLKQSAELLELTSVKLDVNLPALHEGYHAAWQRSEAGVEDESWTTDLPILVKGRRIGRLEISGTRYPDGSVYGWLGQLAELLDSVELRIGELMKDLPVLPPADARVHFADGPARHAPRKVRLTGFWPVDAG